MLPHPLTNFEKQKYYQNEPKFNSVYSSNNLPKIKDETYIINVPEYDSIETLWLALYVNTEKVTYFDCFGVENIPKETKQFIGNKNVIRFNNVQVALHQIYWFHVHIYYRISSYFLLTHVKRITK